MSGSVILGPMRVALVHECLVGYHGSEKVLAALAELWPDAPIFVTLRRPGAVTGTPLAKREFRETWLQGLPWLRDRHRLLLPLMPGAVESHDLRGFDVVISSHHAAAHGVLTRGDQLHVAYTHSPARYAWDLVHEQLPPGKSAPLRRHLLRRFRVWDQLAGQRVDRFIANSQTVAARVRRVYQKDAAVIYPPVEVERFRADREREAFYVSLNRLVPYKRTAVVVEAFNRLGLPLVVIGDGPEFGRLSKLAARNVKLVGALSDDAVADHLERCRALVFAGEEDFGIAPVEAMAAGAQVVALGRGGVAETVTDGVTGVLFNEPTAAAVAAAVRRVEAWAAGGGEGGEGEVAQGPAGPLESRRSAERFGKARFQREVTTLIDQAWTHFLGGRR